ncbi:hypothetical protein SASC598O02_002570, partial [Snodgrassella alvi SCGC AB-598-O02]
RMEKGNSHTSAVQEVQQQYQIPVIPIATLDNLLQMLESENSLAEYRQPVANYRQQYGV